MKEALMLLLLFNQGGTALDRTTETTTQTIPFSSMERCAAAATKLRTALAAREKLEREHAMRVYDAIRGDKPPSPSPGHPPAPLPPLAKIEVYCLAQ